MFSTVYGVTQIYFYARPYTSVWAPDLRKRIIEAVELITPHMLINTLQELEYRLDICRATTGDCNWVDTRWQQYSTHLVDTRWQQYSTHLHTNSTQNTQNGTYITVIP
jgi:hypothetical protein